MNLFHVLHYLSTLRLRMEDRLPRHKQHNSKNPCRVRLTCADGKSPVVPEGYGTVRIPADNAEGYVPIKCCYTPDIPKFILSPNSFKSLLSKQCDGYTLECDDDKKTFRFSVNHKKWKSKSLLLAARDDMWWHVLHPIGSASNAHD